MGSGSWRTGLFTANSLLQLAITCLFTVIVVPEDVWSSEQRLYTESFIFVYYTTQLMKEMAGLLIFSTFADYWTDRWNYVELTGIVTFYVGFGLHFETFLDASSYQHGEEIAIEQPDVNTPLDMGKFMYGLSLSLLWIGNLRFFAFFETLGLFVIMFLRMVEDVLQWLVMYIVFVFSFSALFSGASNTKGLLNKCHIEEAFSSVDSGFFFFV